MTDESKTTSGMSCILALVALALIAPTIIFNGFVLTKLWGWFVVTTFAAPQISIATAIGIALIMRTLTANLKKDNDDAKEYENNPVRMLVREVMQAFVAPSILLLIGWITQGYQ